MRFSLANSSGQRSITVASTSSDFCQCRARSGPTSSARTSPGVRSSAISSSSTPPSSTARRTASAAPTRRPPTRLCSWMSRARISRRLIGSTAGGTSFSMSSRAIPGDSPASPIATMRGRSRPSAARRTNASVIARIARLLGTRIMPRASAIRSWPHCASNPVTKASANDR